MLESLSKFEDGLLRVETWLLVSCVLLMLVLAGYTVFYRNVLIPWQSHLATSGPPVSVERAADGAGGDDGQDAADDEEDFGGGFGGGFGDDEAAGEEAGGFGGGFGEEEPAAEDEAGGFAGGFGEEEPAAEDEAGGFGGGFGQEASDNVEADGGDFGGGFGEGEGGPSEASEEPSEPAEPAREADPEGGPPEEGSLAAWLVGFIDTLQAHWVDELLRQLVIICGFLGAMLATRQRDHITVDALGTLLKGRPRHIVDAVTSVVAAVVCVLLALSGLRLVEFGIEFPRQILPFATNWQMQLAFPIGWSLLSFHFLARGVESAHLAATEEPKAPQASGGREETA